MKKLIILSLVFAVVFGLTSSVIAGPPISTGLTRSIGGGAAPIIKAKWEVLPEEDWIWVDDDSHPDEGYYRLDDSTAAGAQFAPPGVWDDVKPFEICAIVTDPDGISDIDGVYTDWYYPAERAFHPMNPAHPDQNNGGPTPGDTNPNGDVSPSYDYGLSGCEERYEDENELFQLEKLKGYDLFCETIRNDNNNLPVFYENPFNPGYPYDYDEICGQTGELMKEEAYVYCAYKALDWEDPAGYYFVEVLALDKAGLFSYGEEGRPEDPNSNLFEYLPLVGYDVDFSSIAYGDVKLNTHKRISGNKTFSYGDGKPSVRNTGNTRLYMYVEQDDMGLGTTDGNWNVEYDARVGNNDADWRYYSPEEMQPLEDILDLSEVEEMDFSIEVFKFPSTKDEWYGEMWLDATQAEFRQCWST